MPSKGGAARALSLMVAHKRNGFIQSYVQCIEPLAIEIAGLNFVMIEDCQCANSPPCQRGSNVTHKTAGANAHHMAAAEFFLIKSRNLLLTIAGASNAGALIEMSETEDVGFNFFNSFPVDF